MKSNNYTFQELKKAAKNTTGSMPVVRLAILSDSSSQLFTTAVKGYGCLNGVNFEIWEADYDQIDLQVFDMRSDLYAFKPDYIFIHRSVEHLLTSFYKTHDKNGFYEQQAAYTKQLCTQVKGFSQAKLILNNFAEINDWVAGNYAATHNESFVTQVRRLNLELTTLVNDFAGLLIMDLAGMTAQYGYKNMVDAKLYVTADINYSLDFLPHFAAKLFDIIQAARGVIKKCIILDLDNTLWGGIIGDDGIEGIQLGSLGIGKAYTLLQLWLLELKKRGIILAVCSKNTESIAIEPFEKHPDMVLKKSDIAVFVANWDNKVDNILHIQNVLNIGMDSMVFLDDNPFEREMVKNAIPEITVPDLPEDPAEYTQFLKELNLFETTALTKADEDRTRQYQEESKRIELKRTYTNEKEYLQSLKMQCKVEKFNAFNIPRIAQLSQRSNQFNLRTVRLLENEVSGMASNPAFETLAFSLSDIYGDYGLISFVILEQLNSDILFVHSWVMSCRVLKRNMEQFALQCIVDEAKKRNAKTIIGEYLPTAKNGLVKEHYQNLGFTEKDGQWILNLDTPIHTENYINKEIHE